MTNHVLSASKASNVGIAQELCVGVKMTQRRAQHVAALLVHASVPAKELICRSVIAWEAVSHAECRHQNGGEAKVDVNCPDNEQLTWQHVCNLSINSSSRTSGSLVALKLAAPVRVDMEACGGMMDVELAQQGFRLETEVVADQRYHESSASVALAFDPVSLVANVQIGLRGVQSLERSLETATNCLLTIRSSLCVAVVHMSMNCQVPPCSERSAARIAQLSAGLLSLGIPVVCSQESSEIVGESRTRRFATWMAQQPAVGLIHMLALTRLPRRAFDVLTEMGIATSALPLACTRAEGTLALRNTSASSSTVSALGHCTLAGIKQKSSVSMIRNLFATSATPPCGKQFTTQQTHSSTAASVDALEVYVPRHCASAAALEAQGHTASQTHKVLLEWHTTCGEDEDAVSMALTAVHRLVRSAGVDTEAIGKVQIGADSLLDRSKSLKSQMMPFFESRGSSDVEGVDHYLSNTSAMLDCVEWVRNERWDGRWAIGIFLAAIAPGTTAIAALVGPGGNPVSFNAILSGFALPQTFASSCVVVEPPSFDAIGARHLTLQSQFGRTIPASTRPADAYYLTSIATPTPDGSTERSYEFKQVESLRYMHIAAPPSSLSLPGVSPDGAKLAQIVAGLVASAPSGHTLHNAAPQCSYDSSIDVEGALHDVAEALLPGVSEDAPLMEAGLDSLGAVEFRNQLVARLGDAVELPETLVFDFPTLHDIQQHLSLYALPAAAPSAPAVGPPGIDPTLLAQLLAGVSGSSAPVATVSAVPCGIDVEGALHDVAEALLPGVLEDAPLMEAGLDSLGAVEFRNQLVARLGDAVELPETLVFDFPTLHDIQQHLSLYALPAAAPSAPAVGPPGIDPTLLAQLLAGVSGSSAPVATVSAVPCGIDVVVAVRNVAEELLPGVSADVPLMEAGLDSLGAVEFRNRLASSLEDAVEVSETFVFDYPTLRQMTEYLSEQIDPGATPKLVKCAPAIVQSDAIRLAAAPLTTEACAVIGLSYRLPGHVHSNTNLHCAVAAVLDVVAEAPVSRWHPTELPPAKSRDAAASRARHGGFLRSVQLFDGRVFSISNAESIAMDPQQRLVMEYGYAAVHTAAVSRKALFRSDTGVALGITQTEYALVMASSPIGASVHAATGAFLSVAAGRLSYALGLHGPCAAFETACSSSLVASHSATRALRSNECKMHIASGVNLLLSPATSLLLSTAGMTSPAGRSHTFDSRADGFVRGEGCANLILSQGKMQSSPCALCTGSAVRQDGRSASLTAPNGQAQAMLLTSAIADGGISVNEMTTAEAHGTGTALGDPIETGSLSSAIIVPRGVGLGAVTVGSWKANAGHGEAAAGLAGLVKLHLAMECGEVAPNAQLRVLNPTLRGTMRSAPCAFSVQLGCAGNRRSAGGVSSFGYSGTIAHSVMLVAASFKALVTSPLIFKRRVFSWRAAHANLTDSIKMYSACWEAISQQARTKGHAGRSKWLLLKVNAAIERDAAKYRTPQEHREHLNMIAEQPITVYSSGKLVDAVTTLDPVTLMVSSAAEADLSSGVVHVVEPVSGWVDLTTTNVTNVRVLRVKYAIVGAGQSGLQFLHACIEKQRGSVGIADERTAIGGHWRDQYSFVRLHAPKATYGIDTALWTGDKERELASREEILEHYDLTMNAILQNKAVACFLGHSARRVTSTTYGPSVLCTPKSASIGTQPTLLAARGIIDATTNALAWNDPSFLSAPTGTRLMGPAGLPHIEFGPQNTFVIIGGGKSACDTVLYIRRQLGIKKDADCDQIKWIIGTRLAYFQREVQRTADFTPIMGQISDEHDAKPQLKMYALPSYARLFHHFTSEPPETTHLGILSREEVEELRCQSSMEGQRALTMETGNIVVTDGRVVECNSDTVVVTCTGPSRDETARTKMRMTMGAMHNPASIESRRIDDVTLFTLLSDVAVPRSNYFLSQLYFAPVDPLVGLATIKANVKFVVGYGGADHFFHLARTTRSNVEFFEGCGINVNTFTVYASTKQPTKPALRAIDTPSSASNIVFSLASASGIGPANAELRTVLEAVQHLARAALQSAVLFITCSVLGVANSGCLGLARVLRLERSALPVVSADIKSGSGTYTAAQRLWTQVEWQAIDNKFETELSVHGLQGTSMHVARLRSQRVVARQPVAVHNDCAWVITGGLGGLGLRAAHLLARSATKLVLTSRSGHVSKPVAIGAGWDFKACDSADAEEARQLRLQVASNAAISVLHAAGMLRDALLLSMTAKHWTDVLAPKATGAWKVDTSLTRNGPSSLILLSSIAATVGNIGQANYAAANTYLDGFALYRRARCAVQAATLQLPLISNAGMGARLDEQHVLATLTLDEYAACLGNVMLSSGNVPVVMPLSQTLKMAPASIPRYACELPVEQAQRRTNYGVIPIMAAVKPLSSVPAAYSPRFDPQSTQALISRMVSELSGGDVLSTDTPLADAGLDSLAATELSSRLSAHFGTQLSPLIAFEQPAVRAMSAHILTLVNVSQPVEKPSTPAAYSPRFDPQSTQALISRMVSELSGGDVLSTDTPLADAGLDSLAATELSSRLSAHFGTQLSPLIAFEQPAVRAMSAHILTLVNVDEPRIFATRERESMSNSGLNSRTVVADAVQSRWPGGICSIRACQELLLAAGDAISEVRMQRWSTTATARFEIPPTHFSGLVAGVQRFDAAAFGIVRAEVDAMDPQQRLLLELGYGALHAAGHTRATLDGSDAATCIGIDHVDWELLQVLKHSLTVQMRASGYAATGEWRGMAAGRLAFALGLQGPCTAFTTACSSALVAAHHGVGDIRSAKCSTAVAAGSRLVLLPYGMDVGGMIAHDGRSKSFDARANGWGRSENVVAVVLAEAALSAATTAMVGGAVRGDGRSASLTAPNGSAQRNSLELALEDAAMTPADLCNVQLQGLGSAMADPIEVSATVGALKDRASPLVIGTHKGNLGHSEAPSGLAGLFVCTHFMLQQSFAAGHAQLRVLNQMVAQASMPMAGSMLLPTGSVSSSCITTSGVVAFGFTGTIAHAIVCGAAPGTLLTVPAPARIHRYNRRLFAWRPTELLGELVVEEANTMEWEREMGLSERSFHANHQIGHVPLLAGTSFIEIVRAVLYDVSKPCPFKIVAAELTGFLFLDDESSTLFLRMRWDQQTREVEISSKRGNEPTWTENARMQTGITEPDTQTTINIASVQQQCPKYVTGEQFYAAAGNNWQGEFRAMHQNWVRPGSEVLGQVQFEHMRTAPFLRAAAWLDSCNQSCVLVLESDQNATSCLPAELTGRPYYAASIDAYEIHQRGSMQTREMWSVHVPGIESTLFNAKNECVARILGSTVGTLAPGELEGRRQRTRELRQAAKSQLAERGARGSSKLDLSAVLRIAKRVIGDDVSLDADEPLTESGLDSLGTVELRTALQAAAGDGIAVKSDILLEHPTPRLLASALSSTVDEPAEEAATPVWAVRPEAASDLQGGLAMALKGVGIRWPGGVTVAGSRWRIAASTCNLVDQVPVSRWSIDATAATNCAGILRDVELFDNKLYHIASAPAAILDPQQRLLLECSRSALLEGRIDAKRQDIGVFVGMWASEWYTNILRTNPAMGQSMFVDGAWECAASANRVSFEWGFRGPSVSVDTACSSSLVAMQNASLALGHGANCTSCLVAGVNMIFDGSKVERGQQAGLMSRSGRSRPFDSQADGYARSEACSVVLAESAPGNPPTGNLVTVAECAVGYQGRSTSLTTPSGTGQQALLRKALGCAGLAAGSVECYEAAANGSAVGDPIEVETVVSVYLQPGALSSNAGIALSGVKGNCGHAEPASGMVGLLKLTDSLATIQAAANAQLRALSPHVKSMLRSVAPCPLPVQLSELSRSASVKLVGGVSAFGYSGTIAHAVLSCTTERTQCAVPCSSLVRRLVFGWCKAEHPLLQMQRRSEVVGAAAVFSSPAVNILRSLSHDHVVDAHLAVPGVTYMEMLRAATKNVSGTSSSSAAKLEGVQFVQGLLVQDEFTAASVQVECILHEAGFFDICSRWSNGQEFTHCTGDKWGKTIEQAGRGSSVDIILARSADVHAAQISALYAMFEQGRSGLRKRTSKLCVQKTWGSTAHLGPRLSQHPAHVHLAHLDAATHVAFFGFRRADSAGHGMSSAFLPVAIESATMNSIAGDPWTVGTPYASLVLPITRSDTQSLCSAGCGTLPTGRG